jgi:hypothetical protein
VEGVLYCEVRALGDYVSRKENTAVFIQHLTAEDNATIGVCLDHYGTGLHLQGPSLVRQPQAGLSDEPSLDHECVIVNR